MLLLNTRERGRDIRPSPSNRMRADLDPLFRHQPYLIGPRQYRPAYTPTASLMRLSNTFHSPHETRWGSGRSGFGTCGRTTTAGRPCGDCNTRRKRRSACKSATPTNGIINERSESRAGCKPVTRAMRISTCKDRAALSVLFFAAAFPQPMTRTSVKCRN